jgi:hypothetical protein
MTLLKLLSMTHAGLVARNQSLKEAQMVDKQEDDFDFEIEDGPEIEVEDDTPPEDRDRAPMPKELVEELEADELEDYSDKVKTRLKQMKKVWHDERREKERESREKYEALSVAQRMMEENKRLKASLSNGESHLVSSYKDTAEMEAAEARRAYKQAYEEGDSDKVIEAQEKLTEAKYKLQQLKSYRPALQEEEPAVTNTQYAAAPRPDSKTMAWQERNTWWGTDPEMTASALGLHQKLEAKHGAGYTGTDEYWHSIDSTMQRRFPEYFGEATKSTGGNTKPASRPATVVASASRSTSSKKIVLKASQISIAKKLGLTPEQYAREFSKLEN